MMMDAQATTFISTHTPHARRDIALQSRTQHRMISTHTPHARRDPLGGCLALISTHTPHARRDPTHTCHFISAAISTHTPHARRDPVGSVMESTRYDFYSHASCEA